MRVQFKIRTSKILASLLVIAATCFAPTAGAETTNTQNLTLVPPCIGCEASFTVSQVVGPTGTATGVARNTYSGLFEWVLGDDATGRLAPFSNTTRYGVFFDDIHVFQSFLTPRFLTIVSANTTTCPSADADYNYLMIRGRSPNDLRSPMDATSASLFAGGRVSYVHSERAFESASSFSLSSSTPRTINSWYEGIGGEGPSGSSGGIGTACADGKQTVQGFGDLAWDSFATMFHGQNGFVTIGLGGNPSVFLGSPVVVLDNTRMNAFSTSVLSGFLDAWTGTPTRSTTVQKRIYFYPNSDGTSIQLREILSSTDPWSTSLSGNLSCPSNQRNSPMNGFVRCSLTLVGETGTGNAVCMISQRGSQNLIACSAQYPSANSVAVSMMGVGQSRSKLAVTAPVINLASVAPYDMDLTVQNVTGTPVSNTISLPDAGLRLPGHYALLTPTTGAEPNPLFNGTLGECGSSISAYQTCIIRARITPPSVGTYADTFRVRYDSGEGWQNASADLVVTVGITGLAITPPGPYVAGSTQQLTVTATYSNASTQDVTAAVSWQTSNGAVLGISSTGLASFLAASAGTGGSATITASLGTASATLTPVITDTAPVPTLTAQAIRNATGTTHQFTISYADNIAVDVSTLGNADVRVTGPNSFNQTATFDGVDVNVNGSPRVATYSITAPGGTWEPGDDGTYTVSMEASQVSDTNGNSIASGVTGTFAATPMINLGSVPGTVLGNPQNGLSAPRGVFVTSGGKLVVADRGNNRVLIWNTAPTSDYQAPDVVVGQSSLTGTAANQGGTAAANTLNLPSKAIIEGTQLIVSDTGNNRILIYSPVPTSNNASASYVLGQASMTANARNAGGSASATTLGSPRGLWVDSGGRLYATDACNSRVLIWNSVPASNQAAANLVLGQPDMTTVATGTTATTFLGGNFYCNLALADVSGDSSRLFVSDSMNNRVLMWTTLPAANTAAANWVVGQANMTASTSGTTGTTISQPQSVYSNGSVLYVADNAYRVLRWSAIPASNGASAATVLGQVNLTGLAVNLDSGGPLANSFAGVAGVHGTGTTLYVVDSNNNRILKWNALPTTNTPSADVVIGQPSMNNSAPNGFAPTATSNYEPTAFSDGTRLFVADSRFHRVLIWNSIPTQSNAPADLVLGQPDMTSGGANRGSLTPSASSLRAPSGVHYDGTRLFVADYDNSRVLIWSALPTVNGQAADLVVGQASMTTFGNAATATTMSQPSSVFSDGTRLAVADTSNNRVLYYSSIPAANGAAATYAFGQKSLTCRTANKSNSTICAFSGTTAGSLDAPEAVWGDGAGKWFITDTNNSRVLIFSANPTGNYPLASVIVGQSTTTGKLANRGGTAAANTLDYPTGVSQFGTVLAITDGNNQRVLIYNTIPASNGVDANSVIGQPNLTSSTYLGNTYNTFGAPKGVTMGSSNRIWIGDTTGNRVVGMPR